MSLFKKNAYQLGIIIVLSLAILGIGSHYLWTGSINTTAFGHTMNDQVSYITASRSLADSGRLEGSLYYPALLNYYKHHNLLYMPGIYYIQAFFFKVLGYSVFAAFLPNLLAFVGSAVLLFLIAGQLCNKQTAYMSSICFMLFPPVILYAYSAMMEILFIFFCLLAVFIFIKIPQRLRYILGCLTVVVPFLIRESAILMVPGFAILIYFDSAKRPLAKSLCFIFLSLLLVFALKKIPYIADLPPHFILSLVNISGLYTDAFAVKNIHLSYIETVMIFLKNFLQNLNDFRAVLSAPAYWPMGFTYYLMVLVLAFICGPLVLYNRRINKSLGYFTMTTFLMLTGITFSVLMYFMNSGIRQTLFMVPFLFCIVFHALSTSEIWKKRALAIFLATSIFTLSITLFFRSVNNFQGELTNSYTYEKSCNAFLDSLGVSKTHFFVAPHDLSLDYVNNHYPIKWSFVPSNEETLALLADKFMIDMLIIPLNQKLVYDPYGRIRRNLLSGKFILTKSAAFSNVIYLVYMPDERQRAQRVS